MAAGLVHAAGRGFNPVPVRHLAAVQAVTVLQVLRAFAAGATAMTGIEAISNAVPAFEPAEWRNARITLSWMTGLLTGMFAGVLVITRLAGIVPVASQTMLSQLAHLSFGDGPAYIFSDHRDRAAHPAVLRPDRTAASPSRWASRYPRRAAREGRSAATFEPARARA